MLKEIFKQKDIRNRIFFCLFCVVILRIGAQLPVPLLDVSAIKTWFSTNQFGGLSLISALTGGSLENFSILSLSISPYITASIILQLLGVVFPRIAEMQKDESPEKINRINKYVTIGLAAIEAVGLLLMFSNNGLLKLNVFSAITTVISLIAGSMFMIWLGDKITEKGIGNGISIILMLSILARVPSDLLTLYYQFMYTNVWWSQILVALLIFAVITFVIVMVVILDDSKRVITTISSRGKVSGTYKAQSELPIKVNIAGVIPIIFTSSLLSFPLMITNFVGKQFDWEKFFSQSYWFNPTYIKYTIGYILYAFLVVMFAYFYSSITFNPTEIANNLQRNGFIIPGIRPGKPTKEYIVNASSKLILIGALWLLLIATIPMIFNGMFGASVSFGGTSIIIIVGVIIETIQQLESQMASRSYKGFLTK